MTNEMSNVPELRFPEFDGEWEEGTIKSLVHGNLSDGDWINKEYLLPNGKYRIIQTGNISVGKYLNKEKSSKFISQSSYDELKANEVFPGDILISRLADPAGRSIIMPNINWKMVTSVDVAIIRPNKKFESYFLISILNTDKKLYDISKLVSGTSHKRISRKNLEKVKIIYPKIQEQQKIGNFFSKLDQQIELEEKKLELLEQQKRGYMQKIFSQELRFKDENGNDYPDWKLKKLSNIADIIGGGTPSTKKSEYWDGDINWFSPVEIGDKEFVSTSQRRITEKGLEKSSAKMLPIGTVLFTSRAGIGKTAILSKEATTNQGFQSIVPKENDLDSYFLYSMTSILKRNAEKVGAGSTFSEVSRKQMEQIKLLIPILKEQKQIGRLFQIINRKINKQIHKIELLKQRKKGLLQKMFV